MDTFSDWFYVNCGLIAVFCVFKTESPRCRVHWHWVGCARQSDSVCVWCSRTSLRTLYCGFVQLVVCGCDKCFVRRLHKIRTNHVSKYWIWIPEVGKSTHSIWNGKREKRHSLIIKMPTISQFQCNFVFFIYDSNFFFPSVWFLVFTFTAFDYCILKNNVLIMVSFRMRYEF